MLFRLLFCVPLIKTVFLLTQRHSAGFTASLNLPWSLPRVRVIDNSIAELALLGDTTTRIFETSGTVCRLRYRH